MSTPSRLRSVAPDGRTYALGHVPAAPGSPLPAAPMAADLIIPEAEWSTIAGRYRPGMPIFDQGGLGSCTCFASKHTLMSARRMAWYDDVDLSAGYVYGHLTGGRDVGSNPEAALAFLEEHGTPREELCPYPTWKPRQFTAAMKADAPRWRVEIGYAIRSRAALMTALMLRDAVVFTLAVGRLNPGFHRLDAEGCVEMGNGADDHCVAATGRVARSARGTWKIEFANSWGTEWGLDGFAWAHLGDLMARGGWSSYAIRAPRVRDDENPPPPGA